ncbi:MAG: J domain-containing protein [Treponemataceae bacterium]|nr:J domain-containing protein [Treponemataceae bacterium]
MDKFFDRLGEVLRSFLREEEQWFSPPPRSSSQKPFSDPDLDEAYQELEDFLNSRSSRWQRQADFDSYQKEGGFSRQRRENSPGQSVPEALRKDFEELGVPFGANEETCKVAYKRLLKLHHPDRHAGHPANMQRATEKSARINAAYERIQRWRETGRVE